jgi:hypothetical protein
MPPGQDLRNILYDSVFGTIRASHAGWLAPDSSGATKIGIYRQARPFSFEGCKNGDTE